MTDLLRRYGAIMTSYIVVASTIWILGMIVLPQVFMIDTSLWHEDVMRRYRIDIQIEALYVDLQKLDSNIRRIERTEAEASEAEKAILTLGRAELEGQRNEIETEIASLEVEFEKRERIYGLDNYAYFLFGEGVQRIVFMKTIWASLLVTIVALVVCYPLAYYLAQVAPGERAALLVLGLVIPYWINEILRTFAWLMILSYKGIANTFLEGIGLITEPIDFLENSSGVLLGMVYAYILFMILPMYNTIDTLDKNQIEAARDLGSPWWRIHWRIVIPHAKPGIAVGCIMTFMLAAGSFVVPRILGGTRSLWFTQIIYNWFFEGHNWNLGSAYAFLLLVLCVVFILVMMRLFRVSLEDVAK